MIKEPTTKTLGTGIIGVGALAFGAWGLLRPESLAKSMGIGTRAARWVGVRDAVSGLLIATGRRSAAPFVLRALFDFSDAAFMARRKPKVAIGAFAFGLLSLVLSRR